MAGARLHALVRLGRTCLATLGGACFVACAPLAPYNPDRLPMEQMSRIGEICHVVMGLPAGPITQYQACLESLSHSLAARRDAGATLARQACEAQGPKPDTATLADCELHVSPSLLKQTNVALGAAAALPAKASKSYFSASNDEIHRRAREACAQIGYPPIAGGVGFAQCVADLQGNLFDADHPHWVD